MATTANITFFGFKISVSSDGYPDAVMADLEKGQRWVVTFADIHMLTLEQAALLYLHDQGLYDDYSPYQHNHYDYPSYEYFVTKDGVEVKH